MPSIHFLGNDCPRSSFEALNKGSVELVTISALESRAKPMQQNTIQPRFWSERRTIFLCWFFNLRDFKSKNKD
jgi:hypothetical protein